MKFAWIRVLLRDTKLFWLCFGISLLGPFLYVCYFWLCCVVTLLCVLLSFCVSIVVSLCRPISKNWRLSTLTRRPVNNYKKDIDNTKNIFSVYCNAFVWMKSTQRGFCCRGNQDIQCYSTTTKNVTNKNIFTFLECMNLVFVTFFLFVLTW